MAISTFKLNQKPENVPEKVAEIFYLKYTPVYNEKPDEKHSVSPALKAKYEQIATYCFDQLRKPEVNFVSIGLSKLTSEEKQTLIKHWKNSENLEQWSLAYYSLPTLEQRLLAYYYLPIIEWAVDDYRRFDEDALFLKRHDKIRAQLPPYLLTALTMKIKFARCQYEINENQRKEVLWHLNFEGLRAVTFCPNFADCCLAGANFINATIKGDASFYKCALDHCFFTGAALSNNVSFQAAKVTNSDFTGVLPIPDDDKAEQFKFGLTGLPVSMIKAAVRVVNYPKEYKILANYLNTWRHKHSCLAFFGQDIPLDQHYAILYLRGFMHNTAAIPAACEKIQKYFSGDFLNTLNEFAANFKPKVLQPV